jgi:hypothetical protein
MKQNPRTLARAAGLLLAAAALPLAPLFAQDATPVVDIPSPVIQQPTTAPVAAPPPAAPVRSPTMAPVVNTEPSGNEAPPPRAAAERATPKQTRSAARAPDRAPARARTAALAAAPAAEPPEEPGLRTPASLESPAPVATAATPPVATETIPVQVLPNEAPAQSWFASLWPILLGAALLFGAIALLLVRRQRRAETFRHRFEEAPVAAEPEPMIDAPVPFEAGPAIAAAAIAAGTEPPRTDDAPSFFTRKADRSEPNMVVTEEPDPAEAGAAAEAGVGPLVLEHELPPPFVRDDEELAPALAAATTAHTDDSRPDLELQMRPVRAGVKDKDAVVEFELTVDNRGSAPAHDVRVSTWLFPAGAAYATEAERVLIPPRAEEASLREVDPGQTRSIERTAALPTSRIDEDSVLPIVAAEARYKLEDGTEARLFKQFAVGVMLEGELAHFDVENPSGLHDNVEARPVEELEKA